MKNSYRVGNWNQYNKSLVNRGSITFGFSQDSINQWQAKKNPNHFGRPKVFSDSAILTILMIRHIYHLPLRALEGFIVSLIEIMNLHLSVPSYTQICRRAQKLQLPKMFVSRRKRITDIVFDASGLKVYGEGEWIEHKLEKFQETLNKNTKASALALKDLLGTIELEPIQEDCVVENGQLIQVKPYYLAHSNIETLALLDEENKGTNWYLLRTRSQRIRTFSQIPLRVKIPCYQAFPIYQVLAPKIKELKVLGMSNNDIADRLKIHKKTVAKGMLTQN